MPKLSPLIEKQPAEVLDAVIDLNDYFIEQYGGGTIAAVTMTTPGNPGTVNDLALGSTTPTVKPAFVILGDNRSVKVWLAKGIAGSRYRVQAAIQHSSGALEEWEFDVQVRELS